MKKRFSLLLLVTAFMCRAALAQNSEVIKNYIATYKDIAIAEMQRTGVPAAITLAQGIHETGAGTSDLVKRSNNHFGIKCKSDWKGESVSHDDDARGECFRKYNDPYESYRDHSDFLKYRPYYTELFKLDPTDYEGWAYGLKKAGYATNPKYPQILIKLIRDYQLQEYTLIALNKKSVDELVWNKDDQTASEQPVKEEVEEVPVIARSYPSGVFRINETKVIHAAKGTSFLKIASDHKLDLSKLFEFNDREPADIVEKDQLVFLQRKRRIGASEFHTVVNGETLLDIAQEEGIRLENLLAYNHLKKNMQPAPGEKLYLNTTAASMPKLKTESMERTAARESFSPGNSQAEYIVHTVQSKETAYGIAKKYLVELEELMKWNALQSETLRAGQQLRIPKK